MSFISKLFGFSKNKRTEKDSKLSIQNFKSVNSFWESITKEEQWYTKYSPHQFKNLDRYISDLAPLIIQTTNDLRVKMEFTNEEYLKIMEWDNLLIRKDKDDGSNFKLSKHIKFKQFCSNCKKETGFSQRYPKSICRDCYIDLTSLEGRKVAFFNTEAIGYGCQGYYSDTKQKEKYDSSSCFINGKEFFAEEARFGGIVIQLKE